MTGICDMFPDTPDRRTCFIGTRVFFSTRFSLITMQLCVGLFFFFSFSMHLSTGEEYQGPMSTGYTPTPGGYNYTIILRITECETCNATGRSCSGPIVECGSDKSIGHVCSFLLSEITEGAASIVTTVKRCSSDGPCFTDPFSVNMGRGRIARGKITCCIGGDTCEAPTPKLPPINSTITGKHCPACYSLTDSCPTEEADCMGSEDRCLNLSFTSRMGETSSNITMKGCTTESVCNQLSFGYLQFGGTDVVIHKSECGTPSQAPPSTGCSLLALSVFLLMKILS